MDFSCGMKGDDVGYRERVIALLKEIRTACGSRTLGTYRGWLAGVSYGLDEGHAVESVLEQLDEASVRSAFRALVQSV